MCCSVDRALLILLPVEGTRLSGPSRTHYGPTDTTAIIAAKTLCLVAVRTRWKRQKVEEREKVHFRRCWPEGLYWSRFYIGSFGNWRRNRRCRSRAEDEPKRRIQFLVEIATNKQLCHRLWLDLVAWTATVTTTNITTNQHSQYPMPMPGFYFFLCFGHPLLIAVIVMQFWFGGKREPRCSPNVENSRRSQLKVRRPGRRRVLRSWKYRENIGNSKLPVPVCSTLKASLDLRSSIEDVKAYNEIRQWLNLCSYNWAFRGFHICIFIYFYVRNGFGLYSNSAETRGLWSKLPYI